MIYIRNIFKQDLRDGKQIAFPKEASNVFFSFNYSLPDKDRQISFKYETSDSASPHVLLDSQIINTRLYAAGSESRIDGQLKQFLRDKLNTEVDDLLIIKKLNDEKYTFDLIHKGSTLYNQYKKLLAGKNHEVILTESPFESQEDVENKSQNIIQQFADWFIAQDGSRHKYFSDAFGSNNDRLLEHLAKYEQIYKNQFKSDVFTIPKEGHKEFLKTLEENVYTEQGDFYDFSLKTSTHMPRAILGKKNYIAFLNELFAHPKLPQASFEPNAFYQSLKDSNLQFEQSLSSRLIASLCTKPFLILTGLTGSGKTKLAQSFAYWISASTDQYEIVPVGADWTNREPLLGYPDGLSQDPLTYVHPESKILELIIKAEGSELPHFLILDEMNLSHVERYFADFLSIMESGESAKLYSGSTRYDGYGKEVPQEITWPTNLFIIGTVNIDESTYMFSPKVLDRANVIEFRITEKEMEKFLKRDSFIDLTKLKSKGVTMALDFVHQSKSNDVSLDGKIQETLMVFFKELKTLGAEFGYRSANEIAKLMFNLGKVDSQMRQETKIDIAIMQKMLPKLHGSRTKLHPVLEQLGKICLIDIEKWKDYLEANAPTEFEEDDNVKYKLSFEKIVRMYKNASVNGFASYAEA